jgi:hypothetical protein
MSIMAPIQEKLHIASAGCKGAILDYPLRSNVIPDGPAQNLGEAGNSRIASQVATLTSANADLAAVNHAADARILELTAIVEMLERTLCGTRSERLRSDRLSGEQIAFVFDEIATGMAAVEAEL